MTTSATPALTTSTAPITSTTPGEVIENLDLYVAGGAPAINVTSDNVTIRNVRIHVTDGSNGINIQNANNAVVSGVEIDGATPTGNGGGDGAAGIYADTAFKGDHITFRDMGTGINLVDAPGATLSSIEGHDMQGPFPGGQLVQFNRSGDATLTDFYAFNDAATSHPEDVISVAGSSNVQISNGVIDGDNSPSGVGIMFEGASDGGKVENVDAIHMGDGAFSSYSNNVTFDHTRSFDNIMGDQGRGAALSKALIWNVSGSNVTVSNSTYTNPANATNIISQTRQPGEIVTNLTAAPNATPMTHISNVFSWSPHAAPSTVTNTSTVTIDGAVIAGGQLLQNTGSITTTGTVQIGDTSTTAAGITNQAGAKYNLAGDVDIVTGANAASTFDNSGGRLAKTAGTGVSAVTADFQDGNAAAAQIAVDSGMLKFIGASNTFAAQAISGAGTFAIAGGGTSTIAAGTTIATAGWVIGKVGTHVGLAETLSYAGTFNQTNQTTLDLGSNTLSLSGSASFNVGPAGVPLVTGSGTLLTTGTDAIAGLAIGGSTLFRSNGAVLQTGAVTLGGSSNGAAQITDAGVWRIAGDVGIAAGSTAARVNIGGGTLIKTAGGGISVIAPNLTNLNATAGQVEVASGTLELGGTLSGTLSLKVDTGATLVLDKSAAAGTTASFGGAGSTLRLDDAQDFHGAIAGFAKGETLDLQSIAFTGSNKLRYSGSNAPGTLSVSDGSHTAALALQGNYSRTSFALASDSHGGTAVTLV